MRPLTIFDVRSPTRFISLTHTDDGILRLLVREATDLGPPIEPSPKTGLNPEDAWNEISVGARPIQSGAEDRLIEISWDSPVAHVTTDESYALPQRDGRFAPKGGACRIVNDSHFIDFVRSSTFADDDYPGVLTHYWVATEDLVIEVISHIAPRVFVVGLAMS